MRQCLGCRVWPFLIVSLPTCASNVPACENPAWHTVYDLDAAAPHGSSNGCLGEWERMTDLPLEKNVYGTNTILENEYVCSRGTSGKAQVSAIISQGWTYTKIRGELKTYSSGSPDSLRPEPWRGSSTIDDAYLDGVAFARWTSNGRVHVAAYASGLSYVAHVNGNCVCHGGVELAPDWLGDNYYCDSARRGGPTCEIGGFEPPLAGCQSTGCAAKGCNESFYEIGAFFNVPTHDADSKGDLCKGDRYATDADFASTADYPNRPFGSFLYEVPDGLSANDPIEARIMGGQVAWADGAWNNEETAVRNLKVEVYGCRSAGNPVCGDGFVQPPEQCDAGADPLTNQSLNGFSRDCSLGCTAWNLPACKQAGTCVVPPPPPPRGQNMPGKEEVGSTQLPAWIKIADVKFDDLLRSGSSAASDSTDACVNCAARQTLTACPGNLNKLLHPETRSYFCAAPWFTPSARAEYPDSIANFFIALPDDSKAVGFRGRVVTLMKGQLDSFLNVPWMPSDVSPNIHAGSPVNFTHEGMTFYPNERSDSLEGRYVDGLSLTVDCATCANSRQHVFTLAAGTTYKLPATTDTNMTKGDPQLAAKAYPCGGTAAVGRDRDRHCYVGNWTGHLMFSTNTTCAPDDSMKDLAWWASRGGPGYFESYVPNATVEPLEVRFMLGRDTYYENLGILSMDIEACICRENQPRDECVAMCQGTYVECDAGFVSSCSCDAATGACTCTCSPPELTTVNIGVLLPMMGAAAAGRSTSAWSPRVGVYQALLEVNNKTDGVADDLLPGIQLRFAYRDSKCDATSALQGALQLTQSAFGGNGVSAIVGAGCSDASEIAAHVAAGSMVPVISPSSTSPTLSDGNAFPYFLRVAPSDTFAAAAMVDVLQRLFGYQRLAIVHSTDSYGAGGAAAVADEATAVGLSVLAVTKFASGDTDFSTQQLALRTSRVNVVVLYCKAADGGRFLRAAAAAGVGGVGYLYLGSDTLATSTLWESDAALASDPTLRESVLKGFFALALSEQQSSPAFQAYADRRRALPPNGFAPAADGTCNLQTDDDGSYLWAHRHEGDGSTTLACAGPDVSQGAQYDAYGYDATYAIAYALHDLIEVQNRTAIVGSELLNTLITRVSFEGATGLVDFYDAAADAPNIRLYHGDRRVGFSFSLLNYADNTQKLVVVGSWTPCSAGSGTCDWSERWDASGAGLAYSTADNSKPPQQSMVCSYGEVLTSDGRCVCDGGFSLDSITLRYAPCPAGAYLPIGASDCLQCPEHTHSPTSGATSCAECQRGSYPNNARDECVSCSEGFYLLVDQQTCTPCPVGHAAGAPGAAECTPCEAGTYQPTTGGVSCLPCARYTSSLAGSATCDVCAAGRYRDDASVVATPDTCMACPPSSDATCAWNSTLQTWNLTVGKFRLSHNSKEILNCGDIHDDGWSPCAGGVVAGDYGQGYCKDGHMGPRCRICTEGHHHYDKDESKCLQCPEGWIAAVVILCVMLGVLILLYLIFLLIFRPWDSLKATSVRLVAFLKVARDVGPAKAKTTVT